MFILKTVIYISIFIISTKIGISISRKYAYRVNELKELKTALNIFKTKIRYTAEPISDIFTEISANLKTNIKQVFLSAVANMNTYSAGVSWEKSIDESKDLNLDREDINAIKSMGKLLGKTDIDGQISEVELTESFLETQIIKAEKEKEKNEKLYKSLGIVAGIGIVIILL